MVREFIIGQMEKFMMASGAKVSKKVMACGEVFLETLTSVSGRIAKLTVMECTSGRMATATRAAG